MRGAWADESFQEHDRSGFYIIAAALIEDAELETARDAMRQMHGRQAIRKSHWTEMGAADRAQAVKVVADLNGFHTVVIGSPVPPRRQERARRKCLEVLVTQLYDLGVDRLWIEAREPSLNRRDVATVRQARWRLPRGARFHVEHTPGPAEPLLWIADVVAGARRAAALSHGEHWSVLAGQAFSIDVTTDC